MPLRVNLDMLEIIASIKQLVDNRFQLGYLRTANEIVIDPIGVAIVTRIYGSWALARESPVPLGQG